MSKICKKPANKGTEENLWSHYGHHAWSLNEEVPVKVWQKRKNVEIWKKGRFLAAEGSGVAREETCTAEGNGVARSNG